MRDQEFAISVEAFPKSRSGQFDQVFPTGEEMRLKLRQSIVPPTPSSGPE